MEKSIKERFKRLIPSRSRQASRERHDDAESRMSHDAIATASTDVALRSSSPAHLEKYFPGGNTLGLNVLHSPEDAQVDIIFIHGLDGDAYRTWADDKANVYWPVEFLGKAIDNARIIAFGYDSKVISLFSQPIGQNTLRGHADSFLGQIANMRPESSKASKRMIILVVHSLGGLVAKKALCVSAQSPHNHLRQLHENVHGILFLGTPHRGSDLAPNAKRLAKLFKYFGGAAVNPGILEPLLRDSPILEEVENDFGNWMKVKKQFEHITCFYEELEVPGVGFIVSKESATISGTPGPYSIHANHMQMAKFEFPHDPGFRLVHGELKRWIDAMEEKAQLVDGTEAFEVEDVNKMFRSLAFPEMDLRSQAVKDTTSGTCLWAFYSSTYNHFRRDGGLLWIKGKPGSGKSTLLRRIIREFRDSPDTTGDIIASFFFWGSGSELQRSKLGLYRSLLHQLCQAMPQLRSEMTGEFLEKESKRGQSGQAWDWDERQLSDTLMDHLRRRPLPRRTWIFLDALDETGEETAKMIAEFLKNLSSGSPSLGICFTCRHYPIIRAGTDLQMCLEDQNGPDISTHSRAMLVKWGLESAEVEQLCTFIREKAKGVFLWAQLVLDQIDKHHLTKTFPQVKRIIDTTPPELKQMYSEKLQSIDAEDKAQSSAIFRWICFAREPLSLDHLRIALLLDNKGPERTVQELLKADDYIANDDLLLNIVLDRTRGLAQLSLDWRQPGVLSSGPGKTVQLIHQSVRDFLENDSSELGIISAPSHLSLFQSCWKFISFSEYHHPSDEKSSLSSQGSFISSLFSLKWDDNQHASERDILVSDNEPSSLDEIANVEDHEAYHVFLNYAMRHWCHHALAAERGPQFEESIVRVLDILFDYRIGRVWYDVSKRDFGSDNLFRGTHLFNDSGRPRVTLLDAVAGCGLLDVLKLALGEQGLPIELQNSKATTLLHWAAACGQKEVVKWLLSLETVNALINQKSAMERLTPLHLAVTLGHKDIVKELIKHGADTCSKNKWGGTPLHIAVKGRKKSIIRELVEHGGDANAKDDKGTTALHIAVKEGHASIVRELIKHGADTNAKDTSETTPLHLAVRYRLWNIARELAGHCGDTSATDEQGITAEGVGWEENKRYVRTWLGL